MRLARIIAIYLIFPWVSPFLFLHSKLKHGFWQRFGLRGNASTDTTSHIWLHGASAGDVLALVPTAQALKSIRPDLKLTISAMTESGWTVAKRHKATFDSVRYFPWDLPGAIRRTLDQIQPQTIVLEYAELWPELIHQAQERNIRLILHNGRFSRERLEGYQRLFRLTGNLVKALDHLLVRDEAEKQRAIVLGANPESISTTGNTKFDQMPEPPQGSALKDFEESTFFTVEGAPVLVGGSTHEGEDEILLDCMVTLRERFPTLRMVLAPRYTDRASKIQDLAQRHGFQTSRRTAPEPHWDVFILDTVGELSLAYTLSTLVFVGGSINDRGGHNIIEPALCEKPVVFGPFMSNVEDSVQVLLGRGGLQVSNPDQLTRILGELLSDPDRAHELGQKAAAQARSVRGAAQENARLILSSLT